MKPVGIQVGAHELTDDNRTPIEISYENIGRFDRTSDGTKNVFFKGRKANVSTSWDMVTESTTTTTDGKAGAQDMIAAFENNIGPYSVVISYDTGETETKQMLLEEFSYGVLKRLTFSTFYSVSISLSEV